MGFMSKSKKNLCLVISSILLLFLITPAFAIETTPQNPTEEFDLGELVQVINYVDEDGNDRVQKIYFNPDPGSEGLSIDSNGNISVLAETSGSGYYTKEDYVNATDQGMKKYVRAYFVWGYGDVSVSNPTGWCTGLEPGSSVTVSQEKTDTGTGRFAGVFNKYAYAEYSFFTNNMWGQSRFHSIKITVSQSGNVS